MSLQSCVSSEVQAGGTSQHASPLGDERLLLRTNEGRCSMNRLSVALCSSAPFRQDFSNSPSWESAERSSYCSDTAADERRVKIA